MSRLNHAGISVETPSDWETAVSGGGFKLLDQGSREPTVVHLGTFPLPAERGSFGAGAVELMNTDDVLIVLFEYGEESTGTALFAAQGIPRPLNPEDFDRFALQRTIPGQSGLQRFFTEKGRPFSLYVVLGSHIDRIELVARVNMVLDTLVIT
jgi:hypothetical protein